MTTQTNTTPGGLSPRLEIASRLAAGMLADPRPGESTEQVVSWAYSIADALLAADAESRKEEPDTRGPVPEVVRLQQQVLALSADIARVTKERDEAGHDLSVIRANERILRAQLAAALAPLKEEEGLEELGRRELERAHESDDVSPECYCHMVASNARVKARKAQQEGRQA